MKILLLNLYFPPDTSATAKMAAAIVETLATKHHVTVLCGRPSYDPAERRSWRLWRREAHGAARILRVGSTDYSRVSMKLRVLNYLTYVALAVPLSLFVQCDVVLAMTDPPFEGIVGAFVALLKRRLYVYNIQDMYPDMAVGGSLVRPGILSRLWERMHRWALRRADRLIVLGNDMRSRILAKGIPASGIRIVRSGADIPSANAAQLVLDEEVVRQIRGNAKFLLLHAGNIGFYGAWESLITAVRDLASDGIELVFIGEGAQRGYVQTLASDAKNVRFLPFFPSSQISSVLAAADVHVITVKRGLEGVVVPSKMYGILAAGKPILAVAAEECDACSLGTQFGFALSADPDKPESIAAAIRALATDGKRLKSMADSARAAAPQFGRVKELQKFVAIVEEAANA